MHLRVASSEAGKIGIGVISPPTDLPAAEQTRLIGLQFHSARPKRAAEPVERARRRESEKLVPTSEVADSRLRTPRSMQDRGWQPAWLFVCGQRPGAHASVFREKGLDLGDFCFQLVDQDALVFRIVNRRDYQVNPTCFECCIEDGS